jgi:ABC-type multidrug transport system ATPase subunit
MAGVLRPDRGQVSSGGDSSLSDAVALMSQDILALRGVRALDQVAYAGWLAGLGQRTAREQARQCLASVGLSQMRDLPSRHLSGGQLRRLGLAETLIRDSPVLLLDEPTAGLDPAQRQVFREILTGPTLNGRTVVVSTHQIDDLDQTFDKVAVLHKGELVYGGTVAEFLSLDAGRSAERAFAHLVDGGHH